MAAQSVILPITTSFSSCSHNSSPNFITVFTSSFTGLNLSIHPSLSRPQKPGRYSSIVAATVASTPAPPTPEKEATAKSAKWSFRFIKSFAMGELEARKLKFNSTGTEALLMGILVEATTQAIPENANPDGTTPTPHLAFSSSEPSPPAGMVPENAT
ncbi:hypothetical protein Tco_0824915 [Tanacetum coccineum]